MDVREFFWTSTTSRRKQSELSEEFCFEKHHLKFTEVTNSTIQSCNCKMHFNNIDTRRMATRLFFYREVELRQALEWSNSEGRQHESLCEETRKQGRKIILINQKYSVHEHEHNN